MIDDHSQLTFSLKPRVAAIAALVIASGFPIAGQGLEYPLPGRPFKADDVPLGTYVCTVKSAVAVKDAKVNSGAKLPADEATFRVVLKEREDALVVSKACEENRPGKPAVPGTPPQFSSDHQWWYSCLSSYRLELPKSKGGLRLRGDGRHLFLDQNADASFQLRADLGYVFTYPDLAGWHHLEAGQCRHEKSK
jgi:hypothetical protein